MIKLILPIDQMHKDCHVENLHSGFEISDHRNFKPALYPGMSRLKLWFLKLSRDKLVQYIDG